MNSKISNQIEAFNFSELTEERKQTLQPLIDYIQDKHSNQATIRLNFICTHNSRRSHLSQIWAQAAAHYYNINNVFCYSGGTEATAMFPMVAETLANTGFDIEKLSQEENPVYAVKFDTNENPVIGFSKRFDNPFNPESGFAAIMTCSNADQGCPFIAGAEKRLPIMFEDPKAFDNTPLQAEKYNERSLQIAQELSYVFSKIN
ncbi:arsenate-mycothiol transferase ArsC [Formosa haliotis]|uniref:arsenate-mycothiol transferase ArsC n=1 Tax=Formosa haliotis TaxID=1555194 RepID=UPI0008267587|nr:protein-tyrosine-phosphatase [Formosa haliotis]